MSLNRDAMVQVAIEEVVHYRREMRLSDLEEYAGVPLVGLSSAEEVAEALAEVNASGNSDGLAELETDMQESQEVTSTTWFVYDLAKPAES